MSTAENEETEFAVSTPEGEIVAKKSTVDAFEQKFEPLPTDKIEAVEAWEKEANRFVRTYLGEESPVTLKTCDEAFSAWQREEEKQFSEPEVISYLGAYLGQKCVKELGMEWKLVTDQYGQDYCVKATDSETVAYPLSSVAKRIEAETHIFMFPVFYAIRQEVENHRNEE